MQIQEKYSLDEFHAFVNLPENADKLFELIDGVIQEKMTASFLPSMIAITIARFLGNYVAEFDLGYLSGADGTYIISETHEFIPDVGFISKARLPEFPRGEVPIPPDLAVEVVSPSDSVRDVHKKALKYIAGGTKMVWVVFPDEKSIDVYRPTEGGDARIQSLTIDGVLSGDDVVPGFSLPLTSIFPM